MAFNPDYFLGDVKFTDVMIWILGFASIVGMMDYAGILPSRLAKWIAKNRLESTLVALKKLGVRLSWNERTHTLSLIDRTLNAIADKEPVYKVHLRSLLQADSFGGDVNVGSKRRFIAENFIDVMGGSTDFVRVKEYVQIMNTHLSMIDRLEFDFVATPKSGSPILGYEFASSNGKHLVLGVVEKVKDISQVMGNHVHLDYPKSFNLQGKRGLLLDDSTTGGRKMVELAKELRAAGAIVEEAFIIFEPIGKGAREELMRHDIKLLSIVEGPQGKF